MDIEETNNSAVQVIIWVIFGVLLILKMSGVSQMSWWWVFAPFYPTLFVMSVILIMAGFVFIAAGISAIFK